MDNKTKKINPNKNRFKTGEDIDMLHENEQYRKKDNRRPICDYHEDGA